MTSGPDDAGHGAHRRDRLPWQRAVLVLALLSLVGWGAIVLVSRWLLG